MNDTTLLDLSPDQLEKIVADALRLAREGDLLALSASPLARSALLEHWCIGDEPLRSDARGRATQAMLRWLVERLRPSGPHSWKALSWRPYNVLFSFYIEGRRIAEVAEHMAVSEQTIYPIRNQAVAALVKVLREQLALPPDQHENHAIIDLYPQLPADQQTLLRIAAIFSRPMPIALLYHLARSVGMASIEQHLQALVTGGLLLTTDQRTTYVVQPRLLPYMRTLLSPEERHTWHSVAGGHAAARADYLEAAAHLRLAGAFDQAAQLLIEYHQQIIDNLQSTELHTLLTEFRQPEIANPATWVQLQLLIGDVAMQMQDVDTALRAYQQALRATDVRIKAEAYYKRGRAFRLRNTDEAEAHFAYGISLLEESAPDDPLLYRIYLDQAWNLFQDRQDLLKAEQSLRRAETLIDRGDRASWAELLNAWGMFYSHRGEHSQAITYHRQAWLAANETQDIISMMHTAHNLGNDYKALSKYDQALDYFQQCAELAYKTGNRRMQGLCYKSIGACYFLLCEFEQAIEQYQRARAIFAEMQNHNWLANTCCDLAEAFAELGCQARMRRSFDEAAAIAKAAGLDRLLRDLSALARKYVGLYPPDAELNERQRQAFDFVKEHVQITNREYRDLTKVSQKQAARDLNEMVEYQILVRVGDGRSTSYTLS